jgi:hypothetical protein
MSMSNDVQMMDKAFLLKDGDEPSDFSPLIFCNQQQFASRLLV